MMRFLEPLRSRRDRHGRAALELYRELMATPADQLSPEQRVRLEALAAELLETPKQTRPERPVKRTAGTNARPHRRRPGRLF